MKKVDKCGFELTFWSCKHFGNVRRELKEKKKLLEKAEQVAVHTGNNYQVRELKNKVMELMIKENMMWRKRANIFWLIGGDKNMKYFYSRATQRHRQNRISGVLDSNGAWVTQQEQLVDNFIGFYQELFTSSNLVMLEVALNSVPTLLTTKMNALLSQDFMEWEVETALKQMAPLKAPRPDGMPPPPPPPFFYCQNYWNLVGFDVTHTILSYLNSATLPYPINHTFITLVPKIRNP